MSAGARDFAPRYAEQAAEAVRALNHATLPPGGYACAQDVDAVLVELALLAQRLPQTVDQLARGLLELHNAGHVRHDQGAEGEALDYMIDRAADLLTLAHTYSDALGGTLDRARQITAHLYGGAR